MQNEPSYDDFKLLETTPYSTLRNANRSYRRLSKLYHPDKNLTGGDETQQKLITAAWDRIAKYLQKKDIKPPTPQDFELLNINEETTFDDAQSFYKEAIRRHNIKNYDDEDRQKTEREKLVQLIDAWSKIENQFLEQEFLNGHLIEFNVKSEDETDKFGQPPDDSEWRYNPRDPLSTSPFGGASEYHLRIVEDLLIQSAKMELPIYQGEVSFLDIAEALKININNYDNPAEVRYNSDYIRTTLLGQKNRSIIIDNGCAFYPIFMLKIEGETISAKDCLIEFLRELGWLVDQEWNKVKLLIDNEKRRIRYQVGGYLS